MIQWIQSRCVTELKNTNKIISCSQMPQYFIIYFIFLDTSFES